MDELVYHYCDNHKMASILSGKTLRMSDITKSNDYEEVKLFFPGILDAIEDEYRKDEFPLQYMGNTNRDTLGKLLDWEYDILRYEFDRVQLINVNSKMRKIEIIFKAKKAHLPLGENIIFSKDIDSLDLQYFMRLCRI